jgi:hypothetical protein
MATTRFIRERYLTVAQQDLFVRAYFPQFRRVASRGNMGSWEGTLHPFPRSNAYRIAISYEIPFRPVVGVVSPELSVYGTLKRRPHTFRDGSLCVHQPHEWNGNKRIAATVIPWTCLWLAFYETWLETGCWLGEGTHPDLPEHDSGRTR